MIKYYILYILIFYTMFIYSQFTFLACSMNWNPNDVFCWTNQFSQLFSDKSESTDHAEKETLPGINNPEGHSSHSPPARPNRPRAPIPQPPGEEIPTPQPGKSRRGHLETFYLPDLMTPPPPLSNSSTVFSSKFSSFFHYLYPTSFCAFSLILIQLII